MKEIVEKRKPLYTPEGVGGYVCPWVIIRGIFTVADEEAVNVGTRKPQYIRGSGRKERSIRINTEDRKSSNAN